MTVKASARGQRATPSIPDGAERARDVVVIGAGQAGLATGYFLRRLGLDFAILDAHLRVGDAWRHRWDTLRLFTPAFYSGLPGMAFPSADPDHLATRDEAADYLESYARRFGLPVEGDTSVRTLRRADGHFLLDTSHGPIAAEQVVVATGAFQTPVVPAFSADLDPRIAQLHSSQFTNPESLATGDALVVGAGNSGTQIATDIKEAEPMRRVWLSGRDTGLLPRRLLGRDIFRWLAPTILRVRTESRMGRLIRTRTMGRGDAVLSDAHERMVAAGVERVGRTVGVRDDRPAVQIGSGEPALEVASVVWCTGYRPDFSWIEGLPVDEHDIPLHRRGEVTAWPGLYVVGLHFLSRLSSSLMGGVGDDARHVAARIASRRAST